MAQFLFERLDYHDYVLSALLRRMAWLWQYLKILDSVGITHHLLILFKMIIVNDPVFVYIKKCNLVLSD